MTGGDALALVQSVVDMDGIAAWQKLHLTYNPRTLARRMMKIIGVVTPPKISEAKHLVCQIERWEKLVKEMEAEYGEKVSNGMKMAILTSMMPANVQDIIFQQSNDQTKYKDMRDKVVALVMNRVTMQETPVPMDIGNAQMEDFDDQLDVDYAAKDIQCRRCDGWGHFARDCPSDPRKGKGGGKGHARAAGKSGGGSWQGGPKGDGKGKSKGYQGTCYQCGKVGRKKAECMMGKGGRAAYNVEEEDNEEDDEAKDIGGVWLIAGVTRRSRRR